MTCCENCGKTFRCLYYLTRHQSRIKPCTPIKNTQNCNNILGTPKINSETPKINSETPKINSDSPKINSQNNCNYCLNTFSTSWYKNKHQETCTFKDDPVRLLEIQKEINPRTASSKTECRFCNHDFSRIDNLHRHLKVCKEREDYHNQLLKTESRCIIQNQTNIQNQNNITINLIGNENTSHIDIHKIIDNLRKLNCSYGDSHLYLQAGEMVIGFDDLLRENPENRNIYLPNEKSIYTEVKTDSGWEKRERESSLNESFKNSAKLLYNTKDTIENTNKKVFEKKRNNEIFHEVKHFSEKGFEHENASSGEYHQGEQKLIQKKYKIGKLKNKVTLLKDGNKD
jgi:hypothetical protein